MKKYSITLIIFFVTIFGFSQAQITDEVKNNAKALVQAGENVGISIAFINGETVDFYNYGTTDLKNNVKVTNQSIYEINQIYSTLFSAFNYTNPIEFSTTKIQAEKAFLSNVN